MRILALDVGTKTIGVAVSDPLGLIAQPVETIGRGGGELNRLLELVAQYEVDGDCGRPAPPHRWQPGSRGKVCAGVRGPLRTQACGRVAFNRDCFLGRTVYDGASGEGAPRG